VFLPDAVAGSGDLAAPFDTRRTSTFFVGGGGQSSESLAMLPLNATKQKPEINPFKIL